jgi:hypothetical protein
MGQIVLRQVSKTYPGVGVRGADALTASVYFFDAESGRAIGAEKRSAA